MKVDWLAIKKEKHGLIGPYLTDLPSANQCCNFVLLPTLNRSGIGAKAVKVIHTIQRCQSGVGMVVPETYLKPPTARMTGTHAA